MRDKYPRLFATDKELYDLMFSAKQRITEAALHRLTRERGVFFSAPTSRAELAHYISMTIHDLNDVTELVKDAEPGTRRERTSSITISMSLTVSDVQQIVQEYANEEGKHEKVVTVKSSDGVIVTCSYSEFDLSRTTLAQRQDKDATLDIKIEDHRVVIRFPASDKGKELVDALVEKLEKRIDNAVPQDRIDVADLSAEDRTKFFVNLVYKMPNFKLDTVTRLKVSSVASEVEDVDSEEDDQNVEKKAAEMKAISLVNDVALSGNDLLASKQYAQMAQDGFFITSIRWQANQTTHPHDRVEFEAQFEDSHGGSGFQYRARHSRKSERTQTYPHNFKLPEDSVRKILFSILEETARTTLIEIRAGRSTATGGR